MKDDKFCPLTIVYNAKLRTLIAFLQWLGVAFSMGSRLGSPVVSRVESQPIRRVNAMTKSPSSDSEARSLSADDTALDALWRETFGQPLPILGAGHVVRKILKERGVAVPPTPSQKTASKKVEPSETTDAS